MDTPTPPPNSPLTPAGDLLSQIIHSRADQLSRIATMAIGAGVGTYALIAGRPAPDAPVAALVFVVSGNLTDGDLKRFMEFAQAFNQDASAGGKQVTVKWETNLKTTEGDES